MNTRHTILCNAIIHSSSAATAAVGAGLAQAPGSDNAVITPIQIGMVTALGKVFGISISKCEAEAAIASAIAAQVGRAISQALIGWIPGYGNAINAVTAASLTETVGWTIAYDFSQGRESV